MWIAFLLLAPQDDAVENRHVRYLLDHQHEDGSWRIEGKERSRYEAQALLICLALMEVRKGKHRERIDAALKEAIAYLLAEVDEKKKWRISWNHILGVPVYARAKKLKLGDPKKLEAARRTSLRKLEQGQGREGTWSYTDLTGGIHTSFVTASAAYWLLEAKHRSKMLDRSVAVLGKMRQADGAFEYYRPHRETRANKLEGSIARNAVCEQVLLKAGRGSAANLNLALRNFMKHYALLEANYRKFPGTHDGPYALAPYYFFYGHYTTARAAAGSCRDARLKKRTLTFIRSKLIDLEITKVNKDDYNMGFDTFHAMAFTLMTLRLCRN